MMARLAQHFATVAEQPLDVGLTGSGKRDREESRSAHDELRLGDVSKSHGCPV
jgi:hypothetical protein